MSHERLPLRNQPEVQPGEVKRCKSCRQDLPLTAFDTRARGKHGVAANCKSCVQAHYETGTFSCSRCKKGQPGSAFFRGSSGTAVMQPCRECRSSAKKAATRLAQIEKGREPYHLLRDVNAAERTADCRECGPTHIYATGSKQGNGWRCGTRSDSISEEWYTQKASVTDKHASKRWHRIRDVRGDEMRGNCSQCGDVPVRWNQASGHFTCSGPARRQRHAAVERRRKLLLKYGLTQAQYDALNEAQGGRCAICGGTTTRSDSAAGLVVDHDHETGQVRGLLCSPCNTGIGQLQDSIEVLQAAIEYLGRSRRTSI